MPKEKPYRKKRLTKEELEARLSKGGSDSDTYIFDVEYQKLKEERERVRREYERERERYLRISEDLRREMVNGTASDADMARYMSALTTRGVALGQEQQKLQEKLETLGNQRAEVEAQMDELRNVAFSGATRANYRPVKQETEYKGFKTSATGQNYGQAKIVEMSPAEYLRRVSFQFGDGSVESIMRTASPATIEKLMGQMLRGTRFNPPSLNYKGNKTERTNHAIAAFMNGYTRIPVLVIE